MPTRCFCPPERRAGKASRLSESPTFASRASASSRTSSFGRRCTCTGASITFCSTVRCGHSAKCWNTMPMRVRMRDSSRSLMTTPPVRHADRLAFELDLAGIGPLEPVDAAQQRRLARARGPEQADGLAALPTWKLMSSSTVGVAEALGEAGDERRTVAATAPVLRGVAWRSATLIGEPPPALPTATAGLDDQAQAPVEQDRDDEGRERDVVARLDRAGRMGQLGQRDDGEEGAVLDDLDHLVADHRSGRQQQRRQDDAAEQAQPGKAEGMAGLDRLARLGHPGAAQDLGHVGGVVDDQREQPGAPVVEAQPDRGQAVVDDVGEQQERACSACTSTKRSAPKRRRARAATSARA